MSLRSIKDINLQSKRVFVSHFIFLYLFLTEGVLALFLLNFSFCV